MIYNSMNSIEHSTIVYGKNNVCSIPPVPNNILVLTDFNNNKNCYFKILFYDNSKNFVSSNNIQYDIYTNFLDSLPEDVKKSYSRCVKEIIAIYYMHDGLFKQKIYFGKTENYVSLSYNIDENTYIYSIQHTHPLSLTAVPSEADIISDTNMIKNLIKKSIFDVVSDYINGRLKITSNINIKSLNTYITFHENEIYNYLTKHDMPLLLHTREEEYISDLDKSKRTNNGLYKNIRLSISPDSDDILIFPLVVFRSTVSKLFKYNYYKKSIEYVNFNTTYKIFMYPFSNINYDLLEKQPFSQKFFIRKSDLDNLLHRFGKDVNKIYGYLLASMDFEEFFRYLGIEDIINLSKSIIWLFWNDFGRLLKPRVAFGYGTFLPEVIMSYGINKNDYSINDILYQYSKASKRGLERFLDSANFYDNINSFSSDMMFYVNSLIHIKNIMNIGRPRIFSVPMLISSVNLYEPEVPKECVKYI